MLSWSGRGDDRCGRGDAWPAGDRAGQRRGDDRGDLPQFIAVSIGWHDEVNDARDDIAQAIERVRSEEGVLLLTDMFGGTPSNLGMTFLETNRIEVITGVNLPMLIKLASLRSSHDLLGVAREMRDHGRNAIWVASDLLRAEQA